MDITENDEKHIIKMPPIDFEVHPKGIGYFCFDKLHTYKDNVGQICTETGEKDTYNEFLQRAIRTAITMRKLGITTDDIVSLCTFNHLNSMVVPIAAQFLCVKVASFDPTLSEDDTKHLMKQVRPKMIFVLPIALKLVQDAIKHAKCDTKIVVFGPSIMGYKSFEEFLKPVSAKEEAAFKPIVPKSLKETAIILFSSGTTGLPKGICCHHQGLLTQIFFDPFARHTSTNFLSFSSPYWITCWVQFLTALDVGKPRLVASTFKSETFWQIINKFSLSTLFMAPSHLKDALNVRPRNVDVSCLKFITVGGSSLSKEQLLYLRKELPDAKYCSVYGETEATGILTLTGHFLDEKLAEEKAASCGQPQKGVCYKIVDIDTGKTVGPNQQGELLVKSEFIMNGYHNADCSHVWDKENYMRTGDLMYYDKDLFFYHVDRIKEMFKYKSWHVQPVAIEHVIEEHPAVLKAIVFGVPHDFDGDLPTAIVTLKKGFERITADEVKKFTNDRVSERQQLRGGLKILKSIPLTPTGKVQRRMIRDLYLLNRL